MKNIEYDGPIAAAVVLDKDDKLQYLVITENRQESLKAAVPECMQKSVKIDNIDDMRVLLYDFPNIEPIPEIDPEQGERYYTDHLLPAANELGLKPSVEIHAKEIAFAMMHSERIDLSEPENSIRSRSDLAGQYEIFSCGFIDLMGKDATIRLATGEEIEFGLKLDIGLGIHADKLSKLLDELSISDNSVAERRAEAESYTNKVCLAFVLDNKDNDVISVMSASLQDQTLTVTLRDCMRECTRNGEVWDLRVEQYTFPDLASTPEATEENHKVFYDNIFQPTITRMGIRPDVEVHSNEVLYAMKNDMPLELNKPEKSMRLREDYSAQCRTLPERLPELIGRNLHVVFPSGLSLELGLRHNHREKQEKQERSEQSRHVPSVKPTKQKNGIH